MEGANSVDGLISGLPTSDIIDASIEAARAGTVLVEQRRVLSEARLEAVRTFNLRMLSARLDASTLRRASTFETLAATVSDENAVTATSSTSAVAGTYSISVDRVATAQQLATDAQSSDSTSNGTGTLDLQVGNGQTTTLDFSSGASSLQEIASAINDEELGITAFVFDDGTGKRLMLQSDQTGLDGQITATGTDDLATLFGTANSALTEVAAAQDARIYLGSGAGQIQIDSSSNTFTEVIPGVTLEVKEAATDIAVTVANDASSAKEAITTFVDSLNDALSYFNDNASFDADSGEAGILFSESDLRSAVNSLRSDLISGTGAQGAFSTLAGIGITIDEQTGLFEIDEEALDDAFATDPDGVRDLFANSGTATESSVQFVSLSAATTLDAPFSIDITQVALQAATTGSSALDASTTITQGVNDQLDLEINGTSITAILTAGSYTRSELVDHIQSVLDDAVPSPGEAVDVTLDGSDQLVLRTERFGSTAGLTVFNTSTVLSDLKLSAGVHAGQDVAGTIDGVAATGAGRVLTGADGSDAEGLILSVTSSVTLSSVSLTVNKGLAQATHDSLGELTDSATGLLARKQDFLEISIEDMTEQISRSDALLDARRARLEQQFIQLEQILAQFQTQENFLSGQIAAFQNMAASRATGNNG